MNIVKIVSGFLLVGLCTTPSLQAAPEETDSIEIEQVIQQMQAPEDVVALFQKETNPNKRAEIISSLGLIGRQYHVNFKSLPSWTLSLLDRGLQDRNSFVCECTIRKIGELNAHAFESKLIKLYDKVPERFNNSPTQLRQVIVKTLGCLGGNESVSFLIDIVNNRIQSEITNSALNAMGSTCDSRYIVPLRGYIEYWETMLADLDRIEKEDAARDTSKTNNSDSKRSYLKMHIKASVDIAKQIEEHIESGCSNEK